LIFYLSFHYFPLDLIIAAKTGLSVQNIYLAAIGAYFLLYFPVSKLPVFFAQIIEGNGSYDNNYPRKQQERLKGWGQRALAAHQNTIESFPFFVAGVLVAHIGGVEPRLIAKIACLILASRVLFLAAYNLNIAPIRSLSWIASWAGNLALFTLPVCSCVRGVIEIPPEQAFAVVRLFVTQFQKTLGF